MMANGGNEGDMDMEPEGCVVPQGSNSRQAEIRRSLIAHARMFMVQLSEG